MGAWWVHSVLPEVTAGVILGTGGYAKLYFDRKWPFWGRTQERR